MSLDVQFLWRAERDVDHILAWLGQRSPQGAAAWHQAWKDTVYQLRTSAGAFGLAPEDEDQELEIRQVTFRTRSGKDYRALYTIRGNDVFIMHVRSPGQDLIPPDELHLP
jgi:plasmid stabilization system protein ParE